MTWASEWAFLLFVPLLLLVSWLFWNRRQRTPVVRFGAVQHFKKMAKPLRAKLAVLPILLKLLGLSLVIVALARPQKANTKIKKNVEGIDIVVALDISDSMLIEDMQPAENRLEASKETIQQFIEGRVSDRIGLVVFSGESYTRVPLTLDYRILKQSLSEVQTTRNIKMGTAIGVALANAVGRLRDSTAKSRIVIFLTDGENNSGTIDPATALDIAKGYKVKIYSIGMGRDGQAQLPVYIPTPTGQKIKRYRPMHSKVNEELLRKMASETGGKYWRATTSKGLKEVFHAIDDLERTKIEVNRFVKYDEEFYNYLLAGAFFYILSVVLGRTFLRRNP
ncbi:MAG: VWA domain-containing protein [Bdellovibrionales bacterium]|nr:VWA domain-containing protein [Bdellovibrionales bacterium]